MRVEGFGRRVNGSIFRVQGVGSRVHVASLKAVGAWFRVQGFGTGRMVSGSGFRHLHGFGFKFRVSARVG